MAEKKSPTKNLSWFDIIDTFAHDVGSPLNVISGRAELGMRRVGVEHPVHGDLKIIAEQIEKASAMIHALVERSKSKA